MSLQLNIQENMYSISSGLSGINQDISNISTLVYDL